MSIINAGNTTTTSFQVTGDLSGNVLIQSNGTNVATINTAGIILQTGYIQYPDGTTSNTAVSTSNITSSGNVTITASGGVINSQATKGTFVLPTGNTAQRTANAAAGALRYNTDYSTIETWTGSAWNKIVPTPFNYLVSYLIVAGGGAGTGTDVNSGGGGGGAGGLLSATNVTFNPGVTYTITVGAGGSFNGGSGGNSSITGFAAAVGGGGGQGTGGGSGGGTPYDCGSGGSATSGQGNAGGNNYCRGGGNYGGSGGGGAGGAGQTMTSDYVSGGYGGVGVASSITGTSTYYAGGGGGHGQSSSGSGGNGGGGAGNGTSGSSNTGGGGGALGGNGGSGVVILSIPTVSYTGVVTGGPTVTTNGTNTVVKYTSSGSYVG